jgi:uncharacterized protein (DUF2267 family)
VDEQSLVSKVAELGGFAGRHEAMRAVRATVLAIGERLRDDERALLARDLPPSTHLALERCGYEGDFPLEQLYVRVARHEGVQLGFAVEHAKIVCRALGETLPGESLARLRREVGPAFAALFDRLPPIPTIPRSTSTAGSTLASGRDGSRHPLSESRYDRAHTESVVRSADPHGHSKLSGAHGTTQEQVGETLATGHSGARRTLADTKE